MKRLGFVFIALFVLAACSKKYTAANLPREFVEIGSGGGFTGIYTYYKITPNGQVFKTASGASGYAEVGKLPKKIAKNAIKHLNKAVDSCDAKSGNMNYFVFLGTKDTMYNWLWSDSNKPPAAAVDMVYTSLLDKLNTLIKNK